MKLAKKVLVFVVALAIMSTVALTAFAADTSLSISAPKTAAVGDEITVTATLNGAKGLANGSFIVKYDEKAYELVKVEAKAEGASGSTAGYSDKAQGATSAIAYNDGAEADSLDVVVLTLKVVGDPGKAEPFTAGVLNGDLSNVDGDDLSANVADVADGAVTITDKAAEPETPATPDAPATDDAVPSPQPAQVDGNKGTSIPKTGDAGIAVVATISALAAAAFVVSKKSK